MKMKNKKKKFWLNQRILYAPYAKMFVNSIPKNKDYELLSEVVRDPSYWEMKDNSEMIDLNKDSEEILEQCIIAEETLLCYNFVLNILEQISNVFYKKLFLLNILLIIQI